MAGRYLPCGGRGDRTELQPAVLETAALPIELHPALSPARAGPAPPASPRQREARGDSGHAGGGASRPRGASVRDRARSTANSGLRRSHVVVPRASSAARRLLHDGAMTAVSAQDRPHPPPTAARPAAHSRRIAGIAESATLAVDAKAKALQGRGQARHRLRRRGAGLPTPDYIRCRGGRRGRREPAMHRYTPAGGCPRSRRVIVAKTARDSGLQITPANAPTTNGGKQAVYEALATRLDPGDEGLLPPHHRPGPPTRG